MSVAFSVMPGTMSVIGRCNCDKVYAFVRPKSSTLSATKLAALRLLGTATRRTLRICHGPSAARYLRRSAAANGTLTVCAPTARLLRPPPRATAPAAVRNSANVS